MADKSKAQLEQEAVKSAAYLQSLRQPFVQARRLSEGDSPERFLEVIQDSLKANGEMLALITSLREPLVKAALLTDDASPEQLVAAVLGMIDEASLHAEELRGRDAIIAELRSSPLMQVDAATGQVTRVGETVPDAGDIPEAEIRAKTRAGLTRAQAIEVIERQRAEDEAQHPESGD